MEGKADKSNEQAEGEAPETFDELDDLSKERAPSGRAVTRFNDWELMENLRFTNALYNRTLPGEPVSERSRLGWLHRLIKRFIVRMLGWYVNPAIENQHDFNAYATRAINETKRFLDHLQVNEDILNTSIKRELALFRTNIMFLEKQLEQWMLEFERLVDLRLSAQNQQIARDWDDPGGSMPRERDLVDSLDTLTLMLLVYGSPREQKERLRIFLEYFEGCSQAVVIGCGRGEFLQLLEAEGVSAHGVETNAALAAYCGEYDLGVTVGDPIEYMESLEDSSIDGVLVTKLTAHRSPARLLRLLQVCGEKLRDDAVLIMEAPNPFMLRAVTSFAPDGSEWAYPLSPEVLKPFCVASGFLEPRVISLNSRIPHEQPEELELRAGDAALDPWQRDLAEAFNSNFRRIYGMLSGFRDDVLVMRRSARDDMLGSPGGPTSSALGV